MEHLAEQQEIVVVGGGVAGLQAALVLGRARRGVTVVDGGEPRNAPAHAVHNLAGHEGISPGALLARARSDAQRYDVGIRPGSVAEARYSGSRWHLSLRDGGLLRARAVVLATGVTEDLPAVEGLAVLWGGDVVSCPYCHGWEARDQPVAVVGSGARAWQQLLLLHRFTDDLALLSNGPTGLDEQQLGYARQMGISVRTDPISRVVSSRGRLSHVEFADGRSLPRSALFASTTRRLASCPAARMGCTLTGEAIATDDDGYTGVPGVWAAGTCAHPALTVAGAAGHATTTAIALNGALIAEETAKVFAGG